MVASVPFNWNKLPALTNGTLGMSSPPSSEPLQVTRRGLTTQKAALSLTHEGLATVGKMIDLAENRFRCPPGSRIGTTGDAFAYPCPWHPSLRKRKYDEGLR